MSVEYSGHVLQQLLPRDRFEQHPEYFPAGDDGVRAARGNLCVSNSDAVALVEEGALAYVHDHPKTRCCTSVGARRLAGRVVPMRPMPRAAAADSIYGYRQRDRRALAADPNAPPIAYLAYHDTIKPRPA